MSTPVLDTAIESDEKCVIDVIVRAFAADPAARWGGLIPRNTFCIFLALSRLLVVKRLRMELLTMLKATPQQHYGFHQMSILTKTN